VNFECDRLFVYGALMDPSERRRLLGRSVCAIPARLPNYARGRKRYFFVVPYQGSEVEGEILHPIAASDFSILDKYEDVPRLYTRALVEVTDQTGSICRCWIYLPTGWER